MLQLFYYKVGIGVDNHSTLGEVCIGTDNRHSVLILDGVVFSYGRTLVQAAMIKSVP